MPIAFKLNKKPRIFSKGSSTLINTHTHNIQIIVQFKVPFPSTPLSF